MITKMINFEELTINMTEAETQPKKVNFDFFQVWKVSENEERTFDLDDWCEILPAINGKGSLDRRNIRYSGDIIRCDNVTIDSPEKNPLTVLHFTKLRNSSSPAVATLLTPDLSDVSLGADEYIAEDVSAIFDSTNFCLMLQKNIFSLSVFSLAKYVNYFWNKDKSEDEMEEIEFRPILKKDSFQIGMNAKKINKFSFKTGNIVRGTGINNIFQSGISGAIESLEKYSGVSIEVTVSTTRSKTSVLDRDEVIQSVKEIKDNLNDFKKASITSGDSGRSVPIELIAGKVSTSQIFNVPIKDFLDPETVQQDMVEIYSQNHNNFKNEVDKNLVKNPK